MANIVGLVALALRVRAVEEEQRAATTISDVVLRQIRQRQPVDTSWTEHYRQRPSERMGNVPIERGWVQLPIVHDGVKAEARLGSRSRHVSILRFGARPHVIPTNIGRNPLIFWWDKPMNCVEKTWGGRRYILPGWRAMRWVQHPGITVAGDFVAQGAKDARARARAALHEAVLMTGRVLDELPYFRRVT